MHVHNFPVDAQMVAATDYKPVPKHIGKLTADDVEHFRKFFGEKLITLFGPDLYYCGIIKDGWHIFTDKDGWTKFRQLQKRNTQ